MTYLQQRIEQMQVVIARITAQRDNLLEACKLALHDIALSDTRCEIPYQVQIALKALQRAIEQVEAQRKGKR